jgi:epoxyqueuosine reductase
MHSLENRIKEQARQLGFELAGIAAATEADTFDCYQEWLDRDYAGEMSYLHRHEEARRHPSGVLKEVRSVIMLGMSYNPEARGQRSEVRSQKSEVSQSKPTDGTPWEDAPPTGKVARYARGLDYHDILRGKLNALLAWLQQESPGCIGRGVVDSAPLLERDFARRAGLGWFGKNTMLIHKKRGSYLFLAALLVNLDLKADAPFAANHCGTCTACLDACPTEAFVGPGVMDARRCISYLTIELKGSIEPELRPHMEDWLFGCDICQEVCPWNRKAPAGTEPAFHFHADWEAMDLIELLGLSEMEFRKRFRDTPLFRTKRRGLLRNAAIVLGNIGDKAALPALGRAAQDEDEIIRDAAIWALEQIRTRMEQ